MKTSFRYILGLGILTTLGSACSTDNGGSFANGIGGNAENAVYMGNSNASGVIAVLASDSEGASFSVTPRLARLATEPVEVTLEVDEATLNEYNRKNNLSVKPIKPEDVIFTDADGNEHKGKITVTIKNGELMTAVPSRITSLDPTVYPYGGRYAVPVRISSVSSARLLSEPQTTIVSLNRKIKTSVLHVKNTTDIGDKTTMAFRPKVPYAQPIDTEFTMQYIAQFSNISGDNMTTMSLSPGFYNRISANAGLQIKSEGRDGSDTWTNKPLKANEWLHVSFVYRKQGLAGNLSVYVNGELHKTFITSPMSMGNGSLAFGNGKAWGTTGMKDYYLREVRFWSRALTQAEILDKIYLPEGADSEGLEACFPMTRETFDTSTNRFLDITGKWQWSIVQHNNADALTYGRDYEIVENVVFPATSFLQEP